MLLAKEPLLLHTILFMKASGLQQVGLPMLQHAQNRAFTSLLQELTLILPVLLHSNGTAGTG